MIIWTSTVSFKTFLQNSKNSSNLKSSVLEKIYTPQSGLFKDE